MSKSYRYNEEEYEEAEYSRNRAKSRRSNRKLKRSQQETFIVEGERINNDIEENMARRNFYS